MTDLAEVPLSSVYLDAGALAQIAPATSCAYFFDVDGTLLEIRPRPTDVVADEPLRALLSRLSAAVNGALALVSGRMILDIDRIFAPLLFPAAGLHGAEIRFSDGARTGTGQEVMDPARELVRQFVSARPGLLLEDKGATLAVHFRQRPELEREVVEFLSAFASAGGMALQIGKMVGELKPVQFDKGRAIAALLETPPFRGRTPLFVGDDLTDEKGFAYVNRVGGVSIRVGAADVATEARFRLADPAALRAQLQAIEA